MIKWICRFGQVYEGEGYKVLWFSLLGAMLQAGIGIGYVSSDSLFIAYLGVEQLPYIYFIMPFCMLIVTPAVSLLTQTFGAWKMQGFTCIGLAAGGLGMYGLNQLARAGGGEAYTLYYFIKLFSAICYISVYTIYWNFVDNYFDILSAKRLFPLLGGTCAIGSMVGGYLVTVCMDQQIPVGYLFVLWAGLSALSLFPTWKLQKFPLLMHFDDDAEKSVVEQIAVLRKGFFQSRYALLLAISSFLVLILVPLCEYQYMQVFEDVYQSEQELADLLGLLFMTANLFNTFVILFVFKRIVINFGVRNLALIQPVVYLTAFTGYVAFFGSEDLMFWMAVFGFFAFQGVHTSIEYNNFNLIINPIPRDIKKSVRTLIEGWAEPFGSAVAGALLLVLSLYFGFTHLGVSVVAACMCLLYFASILWLRSSYTTAMIENLRSEWLDFNRSEDTIFDEISEPELSSLQKAIHSDRWEDRISACRQLWHHDRIFALENLLNLWSDASYEERVAYRSLLSEMVMSQDNDVIRLVLDWLIMQDDESRKNVIQLLDQHNLVSTSILLEMLQADVPETRASASGLLWNHWDIEKRPVVLQTFTELIRGNSREKQLAIRSLAKIRESRYAFYLKSFFDDDDPAVRRAAQVTLVKIADHQNRNLIHDILSVLDVRDDEQCAAIFHAIERIGDSSCIPMMLERAHEFSPLVRRQIQQTIFEIGLKSVPTCIRVMGNERFSHEGRSIAARAIAQMAFPQIESQLPSLIQREIQRAYHMIYSYQVLSEDSQSTNGLTCLKMFYQDEQTQSLRFIIELLSLGGRFANHEMISASLDSSSRATRSNAIETLEQSVNRNIYRMLLPLVDGQSPAQQVEFFHKRFQVESLTSAQVVESALQSSNPLEKAIALQTQLEQTECDENPQNGRRQSHVY